MTMRKKRLLSIVLAAALMFSTLPASVFTAQASGVDIENGLLAYYDFDSDDENPTVIADKSGNGNDATVLNNTDMGKVLTVSGGAASFPGIVKPWRTAYLGAALKLPNDFNSGITDFTFSAWIKADSSYAYNDQLTRIFDFGNIASDNAYNSIFARYTPLTGLLRIQDRGPDSSTYREKTLSDTPFTDSWGLLTVTFEYDGEKYYKVKAYVNGTLEGDLAPDALFTRSLSDLGELDDSSNGLFIGRTVWGATGQYVEENPDFCGLMDEIRIYSRAISADEVRYLYENTSPVGEITMASYAVSDVSTKEGDYPSLPETVSVIYTTGATKDESVTWDAVSPSDYAQAGSFYVSGVTENGFEVRVKVVVVEKDTSVLSNGLVLYYTFDTDSSEPSEILDVSGSGNNASVSNNYETVQSGFGPWATTTVVDQKITVADGVAVFPGGQAVQSGFGSSAYYSGAALKLPEGVNEGIEDFTYSAWIYADTSYTYASQMQRFFDFGKVTSEKTNSIFYRYTPSSGLSRFQDRYIGTSTDDSASLISATLSDKPFNDNWAMLTVVYKKSAAGYYKPTIYINGEERYEYDNSITTLTRSLSDLGALTEETNGLWIGRTQWADGSNPDFCGKMDEIRLYDRALSAAEVSELYTVKKPSDMPVDYESLPKTEVKAVEDTIASGQYPSRNFKDETALVVSSTSGSGSSRAGYTRYGFVRFDFTNEEIAKAANAEKTILDMHCTSIANSGSAIYSCYGLTGEADGWDVETLTMNNYSEQIGGTISNDGVSEAGVLLDSYNTTGGSADFEMQWDVTDFVKENAASGLSFLITANTTAGSFDSSETETGPKLIIYQTGTPVTVNKVTDEGEKISTGTVYAIEGESYTYTPSDRLTAYDNTIYVFDEEASSLTVDSVYEGSEVTVVYKKAQSVTAEELNVLTYVGKAPSMPRVITVTADGESALFAAEWEDIDPELYAEKGEFTASGSIVSISAGIEATVTVFPEYNGAVGGDLTINMYTDGSLAQSLLVPAAYGTTFTLPQSYEAFGTMYVLDRIEGDVTEIGGSIVMNELNQRIDLYYVMKNGFDASLTASIKADNLEGTEFSLRVEASILNTEDEDETVLLIIANYDSEGIVTDCIVESAEAAARTGDTVTISVKIPYKEETDKNMEIFLWRDSMEPLADVINAADITVESFVSEEVYGMIPTYDSAVSVVETANDYWQSTYEYNAQPNNVDKAFWDSAAYHTGNIEAYKLLGNEDYLNYSVNWANACGWTGNNYSGDSSSWTWGYNQSQGSNAVLFGDWQICFQTFIDLYNLGVEDADLSRVEEVMGYQVTTDTDAYWWWADALYMVMPVMTKMYNLTGDEIYLDKLYEWFKYAKELMYDGPGGIPASSDGYTTSASLKSGAQYSDPDSYAYLFFRDASYVYPLNPNSGHETEKNFWARGNGWVFAGLAKVLSDMPKDYEHYDEFLNTYMEMAPAIIACQEVDEEGHGFWTQSMLQDYPKGSNGNDEGYETSGTAFFTYGLFWGINNGLLDEETYLEPTLRAWGYLSEVALQSDGKVGYVQPIGSNATQATAASTTQNFGVGAFLLAGCEAARWAQE